MDVIFNLFKVRYAKMDEIITKNCPEIGPDSRINLFINLEPIMRKLMASDIDKYLKVKNKEKVYEMISNVINLASHYRKFFSQNKLYSRVYLYLGYPFYTIYKNHQLYETYRSGYQRDFTQSPKGILLGKLIETAFPMIKHILEYVEGVHLIEPGSIEPSMIPEIVTRHYSEPTLNFILSTDRYDYQYANKGFYIIRPKKESSYIVSKQNVVDIMKLEDKIVNPIQLGSNFVPFINAIIGNKYRDIEKIKSVGLGSIVKMLQMAIDKQIISSDVSSIHILGDIVKDEVRAKIMNNFYVTDIDAQYKTFNMKDIYNITKQLIDRFDNTSLKELNDTYFTNYPMYLIELNDATGLLKTNKKINVFEV